MDEQQRDLILRCRPHIYRDREDPFPVRAVGCTVFTHRQRSESFPKWVADPAEARAKAIIEYAVYFDYDIQHLYDLEHIWVAVDSQEQVTDCWCSFHGMRLRAAGVPSFRMEGNHPVLYCQPGKHAMLPSPELFGLHPDLHRACSEASGGGLLVPAMFADALETNDLLDARICSYIRSRFSFTPSMCFRQEPLAAEQFISWSQMRRAIPKWVREQLDLMEG